MKSRNKNLDFKTKNIKHTFTGNNITSHAGMSPIMKFMRKEKLGHELNTMFETTRHNATKFSIAQVMMAVVMASLSGVNRASRIANFTQDCLIMALLGLKKALNKDVIGVTLKKLGQRGAETLHQYGLEKTKHWLMRLKIRNITLDFDSTVFNVCGHQEGAAKGYNPIKRGSHSYHPIIAFCSEARLVVNSWFRTGSAYTSNGICDFVRQTSVMLPAMVKSVFFRADSGFFNGELFDLLELLEWKYLVKVKLKGLKKLLEKQAWAPCEGSRCEWSCEFQYKAKGWSKSRTLRAIRRISHWEHVGYFGKTEKVPVYEYACYSSSMAGTAQVLHSCYKERSTSETWFEQVKSQLHAGRTLTNSFHANDMLWQLGVMAYNLSVMMRHGVRDAINRQEHATFMDWFINVPAKLVKGSRQLEMQISSHYYQKADWSELAEQLAA